MIPKPFFDSTTKNYCIEYGLTERGRFREINHDERALGAFVLPPFQRPSVWKPSQKVRFIESIWLKLPLGVYVFSVDYSEGHRCDRWLLDGQQRWSAIIEYAQDGFSVYGLRFSELTDPQRRKFRNHPFPALETRDLSPKQCQDVYERLAYGGTSH